MKRKTRALQKLYRYHREVATLAHIATSWHPLAPPIPWKQTTTLAIDPYQEEITLLQLLTLPFQIEPKPFHARLQHFPPPILETLLKEYQQTHRKLLKLARKRLQTIEQNETRYQTLYEEFQTEATLLRLTQDQ